MIFHYQEYWRMRMRTRGTVSGVAALEEWCRREVEDYPGVKITDMSSSWRDGLAFCALIHKHTNNIIDWDSLDHTDWRG